MKIFNKFRSLSRKSKLAVVALTLVAVGIAAVPAAKAEFYPGDRPTFDYNKSTGGDCSDPSNPATQGGRCGSMNGPVFNSFINTPSYGDERPFFDGRRTDEPTTTVQDPITSVNQGSKEVVLRVYVHNNANQNTDCLPAHLTANGCSQIDNSAKGIAHNTKVRILIPTGTDNLLRSRAYISADNAAAVEDTVDLTGTQNFNLSYVAGSAKLLRGTAAYPLSDNIVKDGALIGNNVMDGNLPGCFNYAALIEIHVKVNVAPTPQLQLVKQVKVDGGPSWQKQVSVAPGANVKWLLSTKNVGNPTLNNEIVRDVLPPHVKLVPGSIHLVNGDGDKVQTDGPLFAGGFNIGNYATGATAYITFNTTAEDDFSGCSVTITNIAHARSDQTPTEATDTSNVIITKQNCQAAQTMTCDSLTATIGDNRTVTFHAQASANGGAQLVSYQYDFGDHTPVLTTDQSTVTHTYANEGQFASHLNVQGRVNGNLVSVSGPACAALVNFTTPTPTTTPTTLVNTGPGSVAGIFAAVTVFGTAAYRRLLARRLSRQ